MVAVGYHIELWSGDGRPEAVRPPWSNKPGVRESASGPRISSPLFQNVLGSIIGGGVLTGLNGLSGLLGYTSWLRPIFTVVSPWIFWPTVVFALFGALTIGRAAIALTKSKRHSLPFGPVSALVEPSDPDLLEVDLRSVSPIMVSFSTALPEISVCLRITNHASCDILVTHLTVNVWFSQPTTELFLSAPFVVSANSTKDDVFLNKRLEDSATKYSRAFFDRDDLGKTVYINVTLTCDAGTGMFTKFQNFERRMPDILSIPR